MLQMLIELNLNYVLPPLIMFTIAFGGLWVMAWLLNPKATLRGALLSWFGTNLAAVVIVNIVMMLGYAIHNW